MKKWWNTLPDKYRSLNMVAGFMILLLFSYVFSFSKTIGKYGEYSELKDLRNKQSISSLEYSHLIQELKYYDSLHNLITSVDYQQFLTDFMVKSGDDQRVLLKGLEPSHNNDRVLDIFYLEGSFANLVALVNETETRLTHAQVRNLELKRTYDREDRINRLVLKLILEKRKIDDEN